jgi:hypothetical protein
VVYKNGFVVVINCCRDHYSNCAQVVFFSSIQDDSHISSIKGGGGPFVPCRCLPFVFCMMLVVFNCFFL